MDHVLYIKVKHASFGLLKKKILRKFRDYKLQNFLAPFSENVTH